MRALTLDEKISIKGKLNRRGCRMLAALNMSDALFRWSLCFPKSIKYWHKQEG